MRAETSVGEVALTRPFQVSHTTIGTAHVVRLLVRDDHCGGIGEVSAGPGLAHDDPHDVATHARRVVDTLDGVDSPAALAARLSGARNAGCPSVALMLVEMAVLDLLAKRAVLPLWQLLDLPEPSEISLWHTVSLGEALPDGESRIKVKLGGPHDVGVLDSLREIGRTAEVIVDVNRGWDRNAWRTVEEPLRDARLAAIEDPVADPDLLPDVRAAVPTIPVLLDEGISDLAAVRRAATTADGANIKVTRFGGLLESKRALELLRANGKRAMLGCYIEPPRAIAFAAQLAGLADWTDLDGHLVLASSPRTPSIRFDPRQVGIPALLD